MNFVRYRATSVFNTWVWKERAKIVIADVKRSPVSGQQKQALMLRKLLALCQLELADQSVHIGLLCGTSIQYLCSCI